MSHVHTGISKQADLAFLSKARKIEGMTESNQEKPPEKSGEAPEHQPVLFNEEDSFRAEKPKPPYVMIIILIGIIVVAFMKVQS